MLIATHSGTYRVAPGQTTAKRIGTSKQDTMGFTVVGPGRFLGSGHPDPRDAGEGAPDLLGLIESIDGGRTWHPVSLRGEADLHVLRARGRRVYAYDVAGNRLLVSRNGGRTWLPRSSPGDPLLDIAIDPENPTHAIAETTRALYRSQDEARSWQRVGLRVGYLAWPVRNRLFLVDVFGRVFLSRDAGRTWRQVGEIGDAPASFVAASARELLVALRDGTVMRSQNAGRTWSIRSTA